MLKYGVEGHPKSAHVSVNRWRDRAVRSVVVCCRVRVRELRGRAGNSTNTSRKVYYSWNIYRCLGFKCRVCALNSCGAVVDWHTCRSRLGRRRRSVVMATQERTNPMRIIFVATEVAPWSKVGGLADVISALPMALAARGHEVMTVTPKYADYEGVTRTGIEVPLDLPSVGMGSRWDDTHEVGYDNSDSCGGYEKFRNTKDSLSLPDQERRNRPTVEYNTFNTYPSSGMLENECKTEDCASIDEILHTAELYHIEENGVHRVFVDHPLLFTGDIYAPPKPKETKAPDEDKSEIGAEIASNESEVSCSSLTYLEYIDRGNHTPGSLTYLEADSSRHSMTYIESGSSSSLGDLDLRYSILCQAALAAPALLPRWFSKELPNCASPFNKGNIVFVANDWPAALQVLRLRYQLRDVDEQQEGKCRSFCSKENLFTEDRDLVVDDGDSYKKLNLVELEKILTVYLCSATTAMCIHNLAYQGIFPPEEFPRLCLDSTALTALCSGFDWKCSVKHSVPERKHEKEFAPTDAGYGVLETFHPDDCPCGANHPREAPCQIAARSLRENDTNKSEMHIIDTGTSRKLQIENAKRHLSDTGDFQNSGSYLKPNSTPDNSQANIVIRPSWLSNDVDPIKMCSKVEGNLNFMRGALLTADSIITVSPAYAEEIQEDDTMGCGLREILAERGVTGIMNGIDTDEWNPAIDPQLPPEGRFDTETFVSGKSYMKSALQKRLGLNVAPNATLAVFIGRLTEQKGVDILLSMMPFLFSGPPSTLTELQKKMQEKATVSKSDSGNKVFNVEGKPHSDEIVESDGNVLQVVLLGSGEKWMEKALGGLKNSFPGNVVGVSIFSEELAHWLLAAGDYVLIPSRFEPCGLVAQCAARYGAVPIVSAVGGLRDLVTPDVGIALRAPHPTGNGLGRAEDAKLWAKTLKMLADDSQKSTHHAQQQKCMSLELSWDKPAEEWEKVLRKLFVKV